MLMLEEKRLQNEEEQPDARSEQDSYVSYSVKIVDSLETVKKKYNEENNSKVQIRQLKAVWKAAGKNYDPSSKIEINTWCFARVYMYLDMVKGSKSYKNVEKETFTNSYDGLDLTESFVPTQECFELAAASVEKYNLNFDFKNVDNLYLIEGRNNGYTMLGI